MTYNYFVDLYSPYVLMFIAAMTVNSLITNILDWMNRNKGDVSKKYREFLKIHPLIKKHFTRQKINKALKYTEENESFSDFTSTIHSSIFSLVFLFGLIPFATDFFLTHLNFNTYWTYISLSFLGTLLMTAIDLPFSYYQTFKIEERNGFNKTSKKTFFLDAVKSILLGTTISSIVISVLNFTFLNVRFTLGNAMYLILGFAAFGLIIESFGFTFLKMFNRFTPLNDKKLKKSLDNLFKMAGYRNPKVYVMDASRRSTHSNAFVMGLGRNHKKIVLFDTMLKTYTKDELLAILGHEIGHAKLGHLFLNRVLSFVELSIFTVLTVLLMYNANLLNSFGFDFITPQNVQTYSLLGFMLSTTFISPLKFLLTPLKAKISRTMEYQADRYSTGLTKKKAPLSSSLIKLTAENLSDPFPNETYEAFHYDHPSLKNRISAINNIKTKKNKKK